MVGSATPGQEVLDAIRKQADQTREVSQEPLLHGFQVSAKPFPPQIDFSHAVLPQQHKF